MRVSFRRNWEGGKHKLTAAQYRQLQRNDEKKINRASAIKSIEFRIEDANEGRGTLVSSSQSKDVLVTFLTRSRCAFIRLTVHNVAFVVSLRCLDVVCKRRIARLRVRYGRHDLLAMFCKRNWVILLFARRMINRQEAHFETINKLGPHSEE
jgi:hypothetical protein